MPCRRKPSLRTTEERNALVVANLGLVGCVLQRVARRYGLPSAASDDDLYQEGVLGLLRAAELYDEARGCQFSTFACNAIFDRVMKGLKRAELIWIPEYVQGEGRAGLRARLRPARLDATPGDDGGIWDRGCGETMGALVPARESDDTPPGYDFERVLAHCHTDVQREVLRGRARGETLARVGERIGLTKERVRQIQLAAFAAVRAAAEAGVDFELDEL